MSQQSLDQPIHLSLTATPAQDPYLPLRASLHCIAEAFGQPVFQLVIALVGGISASTCRPCSVITWWWTLPPRCSIALPTITHTGLNTLLESITWNVPMVAIPNAND